MDIHDERHRSDDRQAGCMNRSIRRATDDHSLCFAPCLRAASAVSGHTSRRRVAQYPRSGCHALMCKDQGAGGGRLRRRGGGMESADAGLQEPLVPNHDIPERKGLWGCIVQWCGSFWEHVLTIYHRVAAYFTKSRNSRYKLTPNKQSQWDTLQTLAKTPYDSSHPEHVDLLRGLWVAGFAQPPSTFPPEIQSPRWKDMGWQGDDPGRDVRGAGILGLHCLLTMAQAYPAVFQRLMNKTAGTRSDWEYPFAAAGMNLSFMLAGIAGWQKREQHMREESFQLARLLGDDEVGDFARIFVAAFVLLDNVWLERGASYMEFPVVLNQVREDLVRVLVHPEADAKIESLCSVGTAARL